MQVQKTASRLAAVSGVAVLTVLGTAGPAFADASSSAYTVFIDGVGSVVTVGPTTQSTFLPGGTSTLVEVDASPLLQTGAVTSTTSGDFDAGTSTATATVDDLDVRLGNNPLPGPLPVPRLVDLTATTVEATCTGSPDGTAIGSTTLEDASINLIGLPVITLSATPAPNTNVLSIPGGVASVTLNEQTTEPDGTLIVNAIHITLLSGTGIGSEIIIGHVECGPNVPTPAVPMVAAPFAIGAGLLVVVGGAALARKRRKSAVAVNV